MVGDRNAENRAAIERYGDVEVIGEMPRFAPLTPAALRRWAARRLDREGACWSGFDDREAWSNATARICGIPTRR